MKKEPLVSVIIPNYNHALFLKKRIESVLNQTFQDFEIILLDDCSTDNSLEILHQYKNHPKVKHFEINKINSGSVFKQWVKGINLANSKYTWIAESDDVAHPKFLEKMLNFADQKNDLGLVFCKSIQIDKSGAITSLLSDKYDCFGNQELKDQRRIIKFILKESLIKNASSVLFNNKSFNYVNFEKLSTLKNIGDKFVYVMIGLNKNIYMCNDSLNYCRIHGNNSTTNDIKSKKIYVDRLFMIDYLLPIINDQDAKKILLSYYTSQFFATLDSNFYQFNSAIVKRLRGDNYIHNIKFLILRLIIFSHKILKNKFPFTIRKFLKNNL